ncbi:T9SS type A sorting domain-containing protein [Epilithonimonas zeae]|uniref:type IX secretion system anionic LPS delivery protein PorZ n=1 Tax=Epilithonimonas zeae TaxID=1416779 RepID=UPI00200BD973|nr:T9SS type A sorting domain-containing protein [Epilithonimonas zeae]UQB68373.1 T9SS type A sorting domain-containing protein [Epilithonimonas zeae]
MKKILLIISVFTALIFQAQTSKWSDLFSYNNVLKIREDGDRLIAATENGIFYYYPGTGEIKKLSKANGLHEVKISAFDYNPATQMGIVGYQNGSLDVITPNGIFLIVDIPLATGTTNKKINHIAINGDRAVISAGYGVSLFNMNKREFGDTVFFPATGTNIETVNSAVIKDNAVYVATSKGVKFHEINATFALYSDWNLSSNIIEPAENTNVTFTKIDVGNWIVYAKKIVTKVATSQTAEEFYYTVKYRSGNSVSTINRQFIDVQDLKITDSQIIISDKTNVYLYSNNGVQQKVFDVGENINTALISNNLLYTGTKVSGLFNEQKNSFKPDGPYSNTSYKLSLLNGQIWVSTGSRTSYNQTIAKPLGYYHYDGNSWIYPDLFKLRPDIYYNILDVTPNPSDPSEVFFTNYYSYEFYHSSKGIYKMTNDKLVKTYASEGKWDLSRPVGCTFDSNNNLFCTLSQIEATRTSGFYYYNRTADNFVLNGTSLNDGAQKPIAKDGVLYIPLPRGSGGLLMYNYNNTPLNNSDDALKLLNKNNNLPVENAVSASLDNNDDLWIGTSDGLRILSNPKAAISEENPQTEEIIIEENGLAEELFRDANILQITTDSGNQKWISVDGGGVFYISPSGDKTIYHFTKSNSPLPNDSVTDIQIDEKTGKVYFATIDGIMAYQGDVSEVTSNFGNVLVYPNPVVYAQYKGNVRIKGLAQKTNIRITDAAGNLVHSAVANGGYFEWNLNNQRGVRVASGIYYVLMTNEDGTDTATAKIAVVN